MKNSSKICKHGFCDKQRPARKHRLNHSNLLRRKDFDNIKTCGTIEISNGLQSDPAGNIINLSNKNFTKDVNKLLHKNFNLSQLLKNSIENY